MIGLTIVLLSVSIAANCAAIAFSETSRFYTRVATAFYNDGDEARRLLLNKPWYVRLCDPFLGSRP